MVGDAYDYFSSLPPRMQEAVKEGKAMALPIEASPVELGRWRGWPTWAKETIDTIVRVYREHKHLPVLPLTLKILGSDPQGRLCEYTIVPGMIDDFSDPAKKEKMINAVRQFMATVHADVLIVCTEAFVAMVPNEDYRPGMSRGELEEHRETTSFLFTVQTPSAVYNWIFDGVLDEDSARYVPHGEMYISNEGDEFQHGFTAMFDTPSEGPAVVVAGYDNDDNQDEEDDGEWR